MNHIHEDPATGVSLSVDYTRDAHDVIEYTGVRVLGVDYLPVGPDLTPLFHNLMIITGTATDGTVSGERYLSFIRRELI